MAYFKGLYIPPWRAAVNVVWESVRSHLPEKSRLVRRAQTEMSTVPGSDYGTGAEPGKVAEDGFTGQDGYATMDDGGQDGFAARESYQHSRGATMSVASGGSFDEFGGGDGKSRHKINEWQAAWNVTNAIQVSPMRVKGREGMFEESLIGVKSSSLWKESYIKLLKVINIRR